MQLSDKPSQLTIPFANSGTRTVIPTPSQIGITAGAASLTDGFPPLTRTPIAAGGVPPSGAEINGILYLMSAADRWANVGGGYPYDSTYATAIGGYPKGARLVRTDGIGYWLNTTDNNATDPEAGGAGWVPDLMPGATAVTMTGSNVTLTALQYGQPVIRITGLLTANLNLIFPALVAGWTVINATTGAFTITAKTAAGTGVTVTGSQAIVGDGTNILSVAPTPVATDTGAISWFAKNSAPTGYLKANGTAVSRSTYAALFAAIGTTFGVGDGATTFNLPDLRGEFIRGWDDSRGIDSGRAFGSAQTGSFSNIDAGATAAVISNRSASSGAAGVAQSDLGLDAANLSDYPNALYGAIGATTGGTPLNNTEQGYGVVRPRNIALLACIKY